jgi:hypothetical protein
MSPPMSIDAFSSRVGVAADGACGADAHAGSRLTVALSGSPGDVNRVLDAIWCRDA